MKKMKKLLSLLLSAAMLTASAASVAFADEAKTNVVWIGGSYAADAGAEQGTDAMPEGVTAEPFAKKITDHLADTVYTNGVNYQNAAIGGTTSEYGMARFERDVIAKDPDVVFIEFSGNDMMYTSYFNRISVALENMVRRVQTYEQEKNKDVDIVFFYRPLIQSNTEYDRDQSLAIANVYKPLAEYYGIYELDTTEGAKQLWEADGVTKESLISSDGSHPKALGHYYIAEAANAILDSSPIEHQKYRTYPMNLSYTEVQPTWVSPSNADFYDSTASTGCTANEDGTVTLTGAEGETKTYAFNFSGTSVCVADCTTDGGAGRYTINVDGKQITNGALSTTKHINCLGANHTYAAGTHTLTVTLTGTGTLTIGKVEVDAVANNIDNAAKKDNYSVSVYNDPCDTNADTVDGRAKITEYSKMDKIGGDSSDITVISIAANGTYFPLTYKPTMADGAGINAIAVEYWEYGPGNEVSERGLIVKLLDKDGKEIRQLSEDELVRERNGSNGAWRRYILKANDLPKETAGIKLGRMKDDWRKEEYNNSKPFNTAVADVKIAYAVPEIEGIELSAPTHLGKNATAELSVVTRATNGETATLPEGSVVSYTTDNNNVATVSGNTLTWAGAGKTEVAAKYTLNGKTYTAKKTVSALAIDDYSDTENPEKPANLITDISVILSGNNNGGATFKDGDNSTGVTYSYKAASYNEDGKYWNNDGTHNSWSTFAPNDLKTTTAKGTGTGVAIKLDKYKAGTTYVFSSRVKNASTEGVTPYYGIALLKTRYGNPVGTNEYGTDGMEVTSTDWTDFKATLTFPADWDTLATENAMQTIYHGLGHKSPEGSAVSVERSLDTLYLAEEQAASLSVTADKTDLSLKNGRVKLTAKVLNQLDIPGTLTQDVKWVALNADRTAAADALELTASGSTVTVTPKTGLTAGTYTVAAVSEKYDMIKGITINVTDTIDYTDTAPNEIPANLMTSHKAVDGANDASSIERNDRLVSGEDRYTMKANTGDGWNNYSGFLGCLIVAKNSGGENLSIDNFKAGTSYVYQAAVKSYDTTKTAYYGITQNTTKTYTTEYGKTGMKVTSADWMRFCGTIAIPSSFDEKSTSNWNGQVLAQGIGQQSDIGAAVAVKKALDSGTNGTLNGDGFYLAEEKPIKISVTAKNNDTVLAKGGKIELSAAVVNQLDIPGTLTQDIEWAALNADRTKTVSGITIKKSAGKAVVTASTDLADGNYVIAAMSDTYGMVKGVTVEVKDDLAKKYADYEQPEMPENLIVEKYKTSVMWNSNSDRVTQSGVQTVDGKQARQLTVADTTKGNTWKAFHGSVLRGDESRGASGATAGMVSFDKFEKGTSYVFATKVKNATTDENITPYVGNNVYKSWNYALSAAQGSNEYGTDGMAVTSTEWTDYKSSFTYNATHDNQTNPDLGSAMYWGMSSATPNGASIYYSTDDLYFAEEIPYSLTNTVTSGTAAIENAGELTLSATLTNQLGIPGGLSQELEWVALTADRSAVAAGITVTPSADTKNATVTVPEGTAAGTYVIAVYSPEYAMAKGVTLTVTEKKAAIATMKLAEMEGYVWTSTASVENASCDKVVFILAAYSKDESGKLTLLKVATNPQTVANGKAEIGSDFFLNENDDEDLPNGTIVKAFCWEAGSQKPIALSEDSTAEIVIGNTNEE